MAHCGVEEAALAAAQITQELACMDLVFAEGVTDLAQEDLDACEAEH